MLENQLAEAIVRHLTERLPIDLSTTSTIGEIEQVQRRLETLASDIENNLALILKCIDRAKIMQGKIDVVLIDQCVADLLAVRLDWINADALIFATSFQYRKRGVETKLIIGATAVKTQDDVLIRNIAKARQYYEAIMKGHSFDDIAKSENLSARRVMQIIDLAFLAPTIVQSIVAGDQPIALTTKWLSSNPMPSDWRIQRQIVAAL